MLEKNIQASPKETLSSNSTPTEIANFTRGIKLAQFRKALEYTSINDRLKIISLLIKAANLSP